MDDPVSDRELINWQRELLRRHVDERAPRLSSRHAHLLATGLDAGRARSATLVYAGGGVAHDHRDGFEGHVELLRNHLANRDEQALPHVHLAEERGDAAVSIDGDVGGELIGHQRRARALGERRIDAEHRLQADGHTD